MVVGCSSEGIRSRNQQKSSVDLNIVMVIPIELPELLIVLDRIVVMSLFDTRTGRFFI